MKAFLVISELPFSQERDGLGEVLGQWHGHRISDKPYTVLIVADLTLDEFVQEVRPFSFDLTVVELGAAARVTKIGAT